MATQLTASTSTIVHDESITVPFFRLIGTYEQIYVVHGRFLPKLSHAEARAIAEPTLP